MVSQRLLIINLVNILAGIFVSRSNAFWKAFGGQAMGWGLINIGIAVVGGWFGGKRGAKDDAFSAPILAKESRNLRRLLWINAGLDMLYMLGGWRLARSSGESQPGRRGTGWGIVLQGALLFVFDVFHALRVPKHDRS